MILAEETRKHSDKIAVGATDTVKVFVSSCSEEEVILITEINQLVVDV